MNAWNDYLGPLIFLNDQSMYTLTLGLSMFKGLHEVDVTSIAAITVVLCLPPIVLYTSWAYRVMRGKLTTAYIEENSKSVY